MTTESTHRLLLPQFLRRLPADLAGVVVATIILNGVAFVPLVRDTPIRVPVALAFVLFVPGYVAVAALFPESGDSPAANGDDESDSALEHRRRSGERPRRLGLWRSGVDGVERVGLSLGLSVIIVPLLGLGLNLTPWGIQPVPIAVALTGFVLFVTAIAAARRRALPEAERFRVPYRRWAATGRTRLLEPDTRGDAALNVVLVTSIVLATVTVGYGAFLHPHGDEFSTIAVLTEDDGELVADDYPTEMELEANESLVVQLENHEYRPVDYTVVALEQVVETEDDEIVVDEEAELERFEAELAHDETGTYEYDLEPTLTGEDVRIVWLLYPDDVPAEPSTENAEYYSHIWLTVDEPDADE